MTKKIFLKLTAIVILFTIFLNSCRQESLLLEKQNQEKGVNKVSVLNQEQFERITPLKDEIASIRTKKFNQNNFASRSVQDSLMDGAIIETSKVLLVENGENKTYTFPVSRTYPNNRIENLLLRKNPDNTFTGLLLQYTLTEQEKQQYLNGLQPNISSKVKIYRIDNFNINISSRIQTDVVGCYEITWETGTCDGNQHHAYGDTSCPLIGTSQQAPKPQILSVVDICENNTGGDSGSTGDSGWGTPSTTGGSGGGGSTTPISPFNTFLFMSFDDQLIMCPENDTQCSENWANMAMTVDYFNSLGRPGIILCSYTPIFLLVQNNLLSSSPSPNLSESVTSVGNWIKTLDNTTEEKKMDNYKLAHFTLNEMLNGNQTFGNFILNVKTQNSSMTFNQFLAWFINGYSDNFKERILQLSNVELQEYIIINQEITSSPYDENYVKETNEAFVAFAADGDIDNLTEANMQTTFNNNCCAGLFIQQQTTETVKLISTNYVFYRKFYPEWSKSKCFWEASRETIQLLLDLGGLNPGIGEVCDLTNGVIYTIQGDGVNAALSYGAAIPIAGWFSTGGKFGVKVVNASDIASRQMLKWVIGTNGVIYFGTNTVTEGRAQLRKVLKLTDATKHAHHLIPVEFAQYVIVQKAAKSSSAFHINEALNGIPLATSAHLTGHATYSAKIKGILNNLNQNNLNMSSNEAYNHIVALTSQIKNHINNHPNYNLGQIANLIIYQ